MNRKRCLYDSKKLTPRLAALLAACCLLAAFYSGNPRFLEAALRSYPAPAAVLLQT